MDNPKVIYALLEGQFGEDFESVGFTYDEEFAKKWVNSKQYGWYSYEPLLEKTEI